MCERHFRFEVVDRQTGAVIGRFGCARRARAMQDRKDNEYGAYRYFVRRVSLESAP